MRWRKLRSLLVSVARPMASMELDMVLIQLMAHWSSQVVLRFASEVPLAKISDIFQERVASMVS